MKAFLNLDIVRAFLAGFIVSTGMYIAYEIQDWLFPQLNNQILKGFLLPLIVIYLLLYFVNSLFKKTGLIGFYLKGEKLSIIKIVGIVVGLITGFIVWGILLGPVSP